MVKLAVVLGATTLAALALLPSLNRRQGYPHNGRCLTNLHEVGLAILLYQQDNRGTYPNTFDDLLRDEQIDPSTFTCPLGDDERASRPTTDAVDVLTPGDCSYVYVGRGLTDETAKPTTVGAFEPVSNHGDECHVLYGDGRVVWVDAKHAPGTPAKGPAKSVKR